jgi:hypothetical protein
VLLHKRSPRSFSPKHDWRLKHGSPAYSTEGQDFGKWKSAIPAHQEDRAAAGLKDLKLWYNINDSNEIVVLFEISDVEKARVFVESKDLKDRMTAAGVTATPDNLFLTSD